LLVTVVPFLVVSWRTPNTYPMGGVRRGTATQIPRDPGQPLIALPLWLDNKLDGATGEQAGAVLWVVIIIAVIPWRHLLAQYVMTPGDPWRRSAVSDGEARTV